MNSTNSSFTPNPDAGDENNGDFGGHYGGSIGYGVGISLGMLLLITTFTIATYFCTRSPSSSAPQPATDDPANDRAAAASAAMGIDLEAGLDEGTVKIVYSQAKLRKEMIRDLATSCSICLTDYKDRDMLRVLMECGHQFHRRCVDPWLRRHPTCPLCRTSPLPSPIQTPLAEVVPLARRS